MGLSLAKRTRLWQEQGSVDPPIDAIGLDWGLYRAGPLIEAEILTPISSRYNGELDAALRRGASLHKKMCQSKWSIGRRRLVPVSRPYPNNETLNGLGITSFCQRYSGAERAITPIAGTITHFRSTREYREGAGGRGHAAGSRGAARRRLSCAASLHNRKANDPVYRTARLVFPERLDQPRDERPSYPKRDFQTLVLGQAAASHYFKISGADRLQRLHTSPMIAVRNTCPRQ